MIKRERIIRDKRRRNNVKRRDLSITRTKFHRKQKHTKTQRKYRKNKKRQESQASDAQKIIKDLPSKNIAHLKSKQ